MGKPKAFGYAVADPQLEYSVNLGVTVEFELKCPTLGLREIGIFTTGLHNILSKCIAQMIQGEGYSNDAGGISDELIVCLELTRVAKGSFKGGFTLKLPDSMKKFAKDHKKKILAAILASICAGGMPTVLSNGATVEIDKTGFSAGIESPPECGPNHEQASMLENLAKTNDEVEYEVTSSGCKVRVHVKKK